MIAADAGGASKVSASMLNECPGVGLKPPVPRFVLRPFEAADAERFAEAVRESTDTVGRWMDCATPDCTAGQALEWFERCEQSRSTGIAHEFGIYTPGGEFVGGAALNPFNALHGFCNIGYWVRRSAQRQGAATAAVSALVRIAFDRLGLSRIEFVVAEGNEASLAVARKAGAVHEGLARNRLRLHGRPVAAHVHSFVREEAHG